MRLRCQLYACNITEATYPSIFIPWMCGAVAASLLSTRPASQRTVQIHRLARVLPVCDTLPFAGQASLQRLYRHQRPRRPPLSCRHYVMATQWR